MLISIKKWRKGINYRNNNPSTWIIAGVAVGVGVALCDGVGMGVAVGVAVGVSVGVGVAAPLAAPGVEAMTAKSAALLPVSLPSGKRESD